MTRLTIAIADQKFSFELINGFVYLIEKNSSLTNFSQEYPIKERLFEPTAIIMLYAMGRIKKPHLEKQLKNFEEGFISL
ncbi:hypothetical protein [Chitinophaga sp. GbtcB8]|uniref:hypothetical protein n=1 Tax=Chitinophaga sp. GbtcB8 TaxID=2824753 RepID=UPI001C30FBFB|nr:hypothetical protein [Chitinophaga sp. GbtcB8]